MQSIVSFDVYWIYITFELKRQIYEYFVFSNMDWKQERCEFISMRRKLFYLIQREFAFSVIFTLLLFKSAVVSAFVHFYQKPKYL